MQTYLDRLELHGFKSFPDKTVIKMHKGITAIVGPNGCGKSNVVDSVLWVMGEQKIKNLRGENSEDLIFNGSASKKPLGMTEVGAYFLDQGEPIYIARRFFRTGESKYILNERYCRNKDIQDQLFRLRLGGTNYFIFEQGSIEKLVSLKPSEKRVLIEEAANISKYLIRKKETANKLIIAEQNLDNVQILISDKESRLKELRNQVNYVRRYRQFKNEKTDHHKTLLKRKHDSFQHDFNKHKNEVEKLLSQESVLVKEINNLEKAVMELEEKRWNLDKNLKQNQQKSFDYNNKILGAKNEGDRSKQSRGFKNQRLADIKRSIQNNRREIEDIEKQLEANQQSITGFQEQKKAETAGYEELETKMADLNDRLETTNNDNAGLKSGIFDVQAQLTRVTNSIKDIDKRMIRIENEVASKENFVKQLKDQVSSDEIKEKEEKLEKITGQLAQTETLFQEAEKLYNLNKKIVEELSAKEKNHTNEIRNLENQKNKYLQVKKKLAGQAGNISQFQHHGFLQDLLSSDKQYHQPLESFYFEEMDAPLAERNEDLLQHKLNKSLVKRTHTPIDAETAAAVEKEPGFTAWLKDLYTLKKPELKDFFKNGVLVDSLQNGLRIFTAYGIGIVTVEGETITKDGLLVRNREKGILDVIDEIRGIDEKQVELKKIAEQTKIELDKEKQKQPGLHQELNNLRSRLRSMEKESLQLKTSLDTMKKNRDTNLKRVQFTQSEIELLLQEKEKLQEEFEVLDVKNAELEDSFNQLNQRRDQFREEVQRIKEEINRVEKDYLQKENSITLVKEKINTANQNIKRLTAAKARLNENNKNNELEIKKFTGEIEDHITRETALKEELKQLTQQKDGLEKKVKDQEKELSDLNTGIRGRSTDLNARRKALEDLKETKKILEIELSSIKKDLFQLEEEAFKELSAELKALEAIPQLMEIELDELEEQVNTLNERLIKMRDSNRLNFSAESEFELLTKDYNFLLTQKEDIVKAIEDMSAAIAKIDEESRVSFNDAFASIKTNFEKNFAILFEGGEAELSLIDPDNVLESGLDIKAQPPGKRLLSLNLLSGGEKTLTSLAFLFALFEYKPSPFCVFDEVDASLDEANIQRFLKFLHKLKEKTQFLIITHNFKTMEEADYLYGISMNEPGISSIYSMKMTGKGKFERAEE